MKVKSALAKGKRAIVILPEGPVDVARTQFVWRGSADKEPVLLGVVIRKTVVFSNEIGIPLSVFHSSSFLKGLFSGHRADSGNKVTFFFQSPAAGDVEIEIPPA